MSTEIIESREGTLTPEGRHILPEARQTALERVVVAVSMLGEDEARALMSMSDAELGQTLKSEIAQTASVVRQIRLGMQEARKGGIRRAPRGTGVMRKAASTEADWDSVVDQDKIIDGRQVLVRAKKLLSSADFLPKWGRTKQALSKAVASGRIFTVDVGAATYYPAFYLDPRYDSKQLATVTQALGTLPGWSKWQFFTTQSDYLDGVTPLAALARGRVEEVKKLAVAFIER